MYTLLIGLGAALPLAWQVWRTRDERILTAALVVGIATLVAGRLGYIAMHWNFFSANREQIVSLMSPGYSEHLALLAGWGAACLASRVLQLKAHALLLVSAATLIGIGASVGCIAPGCAYGREVFWQDGTQALGWLLRVDWPDAFGVRNPRWPTQLLMVIWLCVDWVLVWVLHHRQGLKTAPLVWIWLLAFALGDSAIQLLRADETLFMRNIRIEQYFDVILFILSLYRLIHSYPPNRPQT